MTLERNVPIPRCPRARSGGRSRPSTGWRSWPSTTPRRRARRGRFAPRGLVLQPYRGVAQGAKCGRAGRVGGAAPPQAPRPLFRAVSAPDAPGYQRRTVIPKSKDGAVEALRVLRVARAQAVRERRNTLQLLRMTIDSAPEELRDQIRNLTRIQLIRILAAEGAADGLCDVVLFISTGPTRGQILRSCGSGFSSRAAMT